MLSDGLLREGLGKSDLSGREKNRNMLPSKHLVSKLILSQCHHSVQRLGRQFTEDAMQANSYCLLYCQRVILCMVNYGKRSAH